MRYGRYDITPTSASFIVEIDKGTKNSVIKWIRIELSATSRLFINVKRANSLCDLELSQISQ